MTHEELNNLADHLWVARMHTDDRLDLCVLDAAIAVLTRMRDRAKSSQKGNSQ